MLCFMKRENGNALQMISPDRWLRMTPLQLKDRCSADTVTTQQEPSITSIDY